MIDVSFLNDNQKEAVLAEDKYIRVVAGAGSGKTSVLTMRIAHLIQDLNVYSSKILAITFTNKAANEMKERVRKLIKEDISTPWISTIHSLCVRILSEDIMSMGYPRNFTILDAEDQKAILKDAYKELDVDSTIYSYPSLLDYISNNKGANITVERAYELAGSFSAEKPKARIYEYYVNAQNRMYALDFDDLIIWTVNMFKRFSEIRDKWQKRFSYIHVDEFQDIDSIQYELIKLLAGPDNSLYVVGDPDQTIYTWRGADVNIILNFIKDFKDTKNIILNENYRSTDIILKGANTLIKNNRNRVEKDLFTNRISTQKITHYSSPTDEYEALWLASKVVELHSDGQEYKSMAVLYRSNYLSRSIEKKLMEMRVPYIIYGGVRFYERQEVKDALSYLRMVTTGDDLALRRILNKPRRGVGPKTMDTLVTTARKEDKTIYELLRDNNPLSGKVGKALDDFVNKVEGWREESKKEDCIVFKLFEKIIEESGYKAMLEENNELDRIENLKELIDDVKEFSDDNPESSLEDYLQVVSLYGDREETLSSDYLRLMTVHAAKGLEFDTVFVTDLNEGIFPNERAMNEGFKKGVEEERRLAYVAFTRAKNKLFLLDAGGFSYILQRVRTVSRFIEEIDEDCIEHLGVQNNDREDTSIYNSGNSSFEEPTFYTRLLDSEVPIFKKGENVVHETFGDGVVISVNKGTVDVAFAYPHGVKKLVAGHPKLHKKSEVN